MKLLRFYNTLRFLKLTQFHHRLLLRFRLAHLKKQILIPRNNSLCFEPFIPKLKNLQGNQFKFLNLFSRFASFNDTTRGLLWAYNLNYMDWLLQKDMDFVSGAKWIDKFITAIPTNKIGLAPYPTALRGINWIKFISLHYENINSAQLISWNYSLYNQYKLLSKRLEYHLLGNHLLEDAFSLFIASVYFNDITFYRKSSKLLFRELKEQILNDGAHFEQSPMYHCILLDRLLDCYNFAINNDLFKGQKDLTELLRTKAIKMLGHLENIIYLDKSIPLLNDSAYNIAPTPSELFDYAKRLDLSWLPLKMKDCGYRFLRNNAFEVIVDVGNITASYQPGHSHADTLNYELKINGIPFIVDTGISTYDKNKRRQYERSTAAHNTVSINERDSSEVWGGFRVGNRAVITHLEETDTCIFATQNGFGKKHPHSRKFSLHSDSLTITDKIPETDKGISFVHFSPQTKIISQTENRITTNIGIIEISNATHYVITSDYASNQYNLLQEIKVLKIFFFGEMYYSITCNNEDTVSD